MIQLAFRQLARTFPTFATASASSARLLFILSIAADAAAAAASRSALPARRCDAVFGIETGPVFVHPTKVTARTFLLGHIIWLAPNVRRPGLLRLMEIAIVSAAARAEKTGKGVESTSQRVNGSRRESLPDNSAEFDKVIKQ